MLLASEHVDSYPTRERRATGARLDLQVLIYPRQSVMPFQCDGSKELWIAAIELGLCPSTYRPYVPQPDFIMGRQIGHSKEGTGTPIIKPSGIAPSWWPYAPRWFCAAANATTYEGASAWSTRHNQGRFLGLKVTLGSLIDFHPPLPHLKRQPMIIAIAVPRLLLRCHFRPLRTFTNGLRFEQPHSRSPPCTQG